MKLPTKAQWLEVKDDEGMRQRAFFCMMMASITEAGDMKDMIGEV